MASHMCLLFSILFDHSCQQLALYGWGITPMTLGTHGFHSLQFFFLIQSFIFGCLKLFFELVCACMCQVSALLDLNKLKCFGSRWMQPSRLIERRIGDLRMATCSLQFWSSHLVLFAVARDADTHHGQLVDWLRLLRLVKDNMFCTHHHPPKSFATSYGWRDLKSLRPWASLSNIHGQ